MSESYRFVYLTFVLRISTRWPVLDILCLYVSIVSYIICFIYLNVSYRRLVSIRQVYYDLIFIFTRSTKMVKEYPTSFFRESIFFLTVNILLTDNESCLNFTVCNSVSYWIIYVCFSFILDLQSDWKILYILCNVFHWYFYMMKY